MITTKPQNRLELGKEAENAARAYLTSQGVRILIENFRCRIGELDIVALHDGVLLIVEVRMRTQTRHVGAAASIGLLKRRRIIGTAKYLLLTRPQLSRYPTRFDVIALDRKTPHEASRIEWIRNAFDTGAW